MAFPSLAEYERLVYGLQDDLPQVTGTTLRLYSTSALTAILEGSIYLDNGLELRVVEAIDFRAGRVRHYSYSVLRGEDKIRWYDSQPHPESPELAATFPHHLHEPPDIKHNRRPADGITFDSPNLSTLIDHCLALADR